MNALAAEALSVQQLRPHPKNVRRDVVPSEELVASVKAHGILQPLLVIPHPVLEGDYLVIAGHRRLAAAKKAGLGTVPCMVNGTLTDEAEQLAVMLVENLQRTDLTVGEEAKAYQALLELPGWTEAKIAKRTGRAKDTVHGRVKLAGMGEAAIGVVEDRRATLEDVLRLADAGLPEERQTEALSRATVDAWGINAAIASWEREQEAPALAEQARNRGFTVVDRDDVPEGLARAWLDYGDTADQYETVYVVIDAASQWKAEYWGARKKNPKGGEAVPAPRELSEEEQADNARIAELEAGLQIARRVHEETVRKAIRTTKTTEGGPARDALMELLGIDEKWGDTQRAALAMWLETDTDPEAIRTAAAKLTVAGLALLLFASQRIRERALEDIEELEVWHDGGRGDAPYVARQLAVVGSDLSDVEREAIEYWDAREQENSDDEEDDDED